MGESESNETWIQNEIPRTKKKLKQEYKNYYLYGFLFGLTTTCFHTAALNERWWSRQMIVERNGIEKSSQDMLTKIFYNSILFL
jgi:hypothetical protein